MKNKKKIIALIFGSSSLFFFLFFFIILVAVLMILDFFGTTLTKEKVQSNSDYRVAYKESLNKYVQDGYVPLQRILYFYLEDNSLTFDTLYKLNQNDLGKTTREIEDVCLDERVKNMVACSKSNIEENKDYLVVTSQHFNFPLDRTYNITSFYNEERIIYGEKNVHNGWDFSVPERTPVYSICDGTVTQVNYTQNLNVPYERSGNKVGNYITIKCDRDYAETYYVTFHHLYPNSSKVKVGDNVSHFTEIASVGTTGHSTGNHLHYSLFDSNMKLLDGMQFIDLNMKKPIDLRNKDWGKINPILPQN